MREPKSEYANRLIALQACGHFTSAYTHLVKMLEEVLLLMEGRKKNIPNPH